MKKRVLFCDGNKEFSRLVGIVYANHLLTTNVQSICDLIYEIFYTTKVFDVIAIGSDFDIDTDFTEIDELSEITGRYDLNMDSKVFPIELGKLCKELSLSKGKKEPEILIMTSWDIREEAAKNNMYFISPNSQNLRKELTEFFQKIK